MGAFNPKEYDGVEVRIPKFYKDHPEGRIVTRIVSEEDLRIVMIAEVYTDNRDVPSATGYAQEWRDTDLKVNKWGKEYESVNFASHLENCETSAIGRALANFNYTGNKKRPSLQEMTKGKPSPVATPPAPAKKPISVKASAEDLKGCADVIRGKLGDIEDEAIKVIILTVAGVDSLNKLTKEKVTLLHKQLLTTSKDALEIISTGEMIVDDPEDKAIKEAIE